jgi:hypothetical protein
MVLSTNNFTRSGESGQFECVMSRGPVIQIGI